MLDRFFEAFGIQNKIVGFNENLKQQYYDYLLNGFGVLFTYHSNRIEGTNMTFTLNDTKSILNHTFNFSSVVDVNKKREIHETLNHQKAFQYIFDIIDSDLDIITVIRNLHKIVGDGVLADAGDYKKNENYLVNSNGKEVDFTKPDMVGKRMEELREKYYGEWKDLTVYERAVKLHMAIVNVHPFSDCNGRVARLIMNYELIKNNYPPVNFNESQKLAYYSIIEEINVETNYVDCPFEIGDIQLFNETIQQLSIMTFKNIDTYMADK